MIFRERYNILKKQAKRADIHRKKVFFGPKIGICKNMFADAIQDHNYEYCSYGKDCRSRIKDFLISKKIISFLPRFLKRFIYRHILGYSFLKGRRCTEYIFLFSNGYELYGERASFLSFLDYLKKDFKNCKLAIHLYDAVQTDDIRAFFLQYRHYFDTILTFNRYDAIELGIEYYGPVSESGIVEPQGESEESDLFFSGRADLARANLTIKTFKCLSDKGKKCIFFVHFQNVREIIPEFYNQLCNCLGINNPLIDSCCIEYKQSKFYFDTYIPYAQTLSYLLKTKAFLEIVILPEGRASCTSRLAQAMAYKRKLLTNCEITKEEPYYNDHNIFTFSKPEDIDVHFFDTDFQKIEKSFSTVDMLKYMEQRSFGNIAE